MTKTIKDLFTFFRGVEHTTSSDFSDFFSKKSQQKARVIRRVLHEANSEQRKLVNEYHEHLGVS